MLQVIGVRNISENIKPSLFGTEVEDVDFTSSFNTNSKLFFSKIMRESCPEPEICICRCRVPLVSLFFPSVYNKQQVHCKPPDLLKKESIIHEYIDLGQNTLNLINGKDVFNKKNQSPLTSNILIQHDTCLECDVYLMMPQSPIKNSLTDLSDLYERIIIISEDRAIIAKLYRLCVINNYNILKSDFIGYNYLPKVIMFLFV